MGDRVLQRASAKSLANATDEAVDIVGGQRPKAPRAPLVTDVRQQGSNRFAMARDRGARQTANLLQIDRERGDLVLDSRTWSPRKQ
jgi:hypothetical protein